MSDSNRNDYLEEDEESDNEYIVLTDDEGNDVHFELLDSFDYEGSSYVVLIPFEDTDDEVVILSVEDSDSIDENGEPERTDYYPIEDEELLNKVFEEFKKRNADNYDFVD
jgi:uncharacterized protein YrzB (UPF0473 family)